ncbi:hypothetical protein INS49_014066 [Diaporthe citri]|uniref:uncharacterized protein n=1 Tax=Diaporthe citri TaxID=83186 RepID=UPI001C8277E3|nr:uncharacterized protein INS49_014066 [Diaporthe citri]KAG6358182.1 hypothetical protein INS49_014066 [Diaporthe citri]
MYTETSALDKAERGECQEIGSHEEEEARQANGEKQASGPFGLAQVKNYDRRFAFYPGFAVERSLALEFRAEGISQLSMEIQALRKELDSADASKPPNQALTDSAEKLPILMSRLAASMAQYGRITTHTAESSIPQLMSKRKMLPACMGR